MLATFINAMRHGVPTRTNPDDWRLASRAGAAAAGILTAGMPADVSMDSLLCACPFSTTATPETCHWTLSSADLLGLDVPENTLTHYRALSTLRTSAIAKRS